MTLRLLFVSLTVPFRLILQDKLAVCAEDVLSASCDGWR